MALQAQNEQLQADLLNREETISANEQEKAKLQLEKQRLDKEKEVLHLKLGSLTVEQAQRVAVAEEKVVRLDPAAKLHECDFNSTSMLTLHANTLGATDIPHCNVGNPNFRTEIPLNRRFTKEVSFESENGEGMSDTFFVFPCSDRSIQRRSVSCHCSLEQGERQIVESALLEKLRAFVRIEVGRLVAHFRDKPTSGVAKHWLITDMLLKGLDETVVDRRSTLITRIEFPQMPIWIKNVVRDLDGLAVDVTPTHVFLCVGFDLAICSNQNSPEHVSGVILGQIERIIEWWETYVVGEMIDRMCVSMPCKVKLPRFVLFTIPEIGDWNNTWRLVNEHYRKWAADHNRRRRHPAVVHTVEILDWAKMCKDKWGNENGAHRISTFEERVKLLMEQCSAEYGMMLERDNVDMDPT
ncbi:hypothetical protein AAVH_21240 [Aphelenchoides avenae]|nr:hypothetical protein AAVH_21240 [Aphelenchus avenae]